jgi:hypothetical protein
MDDSQHFINKVIERCGGLDETAGSVSDSQESHLTDQRLQTTATLRDSNP